MNKEQKRKVYHNVVGKALVKAIKMDTETAHESRHDTIRTIRRLTKQDWNWLMERLDLYPNSIKDRMEYCQVTADWIGERTIYELRHAKQEREHRNWITNARRIPEAVKEEYEAEYVEEDWQNHLKED